MIKYIDLFGGIGGFSEAGRRINSDRHARKEKQDEHLENSADTKSGNAWEPADDCKFKCVGYYEINKYAVQTYNKNFNTNHKPVDIRTIKEFPDHDLLCAGFPCQTFSIAGKREGFGDTRGTLFFEICRIAGQKRPEHLLLENVKGLLSHDEGRTFGTILKSLDELGYDVQWQVLNSKHWVPQNRERVFIVGHLRGEPRPEIFPITESTKADIKQTEKLRVQVSNTLRTNYSSGYSNETYIEEKDKPMIEQLNNPTHSNDRIYGSDGISPALNTMQGGRRQPKIVINFQKRSADRPALKKNPSAGGHGILRKKDETFCIDSSCGQGIEYPDHKIRRLTPTECERLQGFPDNWTEGISDTQRYKQLGNAVTVDVVEEILRKFARE